MTNMQATKPINAGSSQAAPEQGRLSPRRVAIIAGMGSAVEFYDFSIYGLMAAYLGHKFFPSENSLTALLATLAIFGSAFIVRPLGGLFFGWLGDKYGRSKTLVVTVLGMGIGSVLMGLLPTYETFGVLASVLLLACRLAQGFFAGGELGGASTYISESVPRNRRGLYGAFNPLGAAVGLAAAPAVAAICSMLLSPEQMSSWGWRIPFLLCGPLIALTLYARMFLEDSPQFKHAVEQHKETRTPLKVLFTQYRTPLLKSVGIATAQNAMVYIGLLYFNIHLTRTLGYPASNVFLLMAAAPLLAGFFMPMFGALSDKIGRRPVILTGYASYFVLLPLAMMLMEQGSFALACFGVLLTFVPYSMVQAIGYPLYAELFPTKVRYSGAALGINFGALIGGASAPSLATWLTAVTGDHLSAAYLGMAAACLAVAVLLTVKETAYRELDD